MAWAWGEADGGRLEGTGPGERAKAAWPGWPHPWPASSESR